MDSYQQSQKSKLFKTPPHDPYCQPRMQGSAVCPQCDAVYQAGNWTWNRPENTVVHNAQSVTCPACRRIADNVPAGTLTLSGGRQSPGACAGSRVQGRGALLLRRYSIRRAGHVGT